MDNFSDKNLNHENWQCVSAVVRPEDNSEEIDNREEIVSKDKNRRTIKCPCLTFQLTVSICILLFLFIIKYVSFPMFDHIIKIYDTEISRSVIFDGNSGDFDFSFLISTPDEV